MKRISILFSFCIMFFIQYTFAQNSDKITRVLEYKPALGQHINRLFPTPAFSDTPENALLFASNCLIGNKSMLGLGAYGGYVVVGFDHSIVNVPDEYDFKALGNAASGGAEPGIVMVCQDLNKNGLPDADEPWYELAGSDYNHSQTIHNYEIKYYRPKPDKQKSNIVWKDNQGNNGVVTHITYASQSTMYPLWVSDDSIVFKGTRLRSTVVNNNGTFTLPAFDWGYVDNNANNSANDKISFKIDWAVEETGKSVNLKYIDFVKIYTAQVQEAGWLGETSTEFAGILDLHPQASVVTELNKNTPSNSVNIYPVVFNNFIEVNSSIVQDIKVYNLMGNTILSTQLQAGKNHFETANYPSGVYIIKVRDSTQKIIKN